MDEKFFEEHWKEVEKELLEGKVTFRHAASFLNTYPLVVKKRFKKDHPDFLTKQEAARKKNKDYFESDLWKETEKLLLENKTNYSKASKSSGVDIMIIRKEFLKDYPDFSALGRKGRKVYDFDRNEKWPGVKEKLCSGEMNYQEASKELNIPWVSIRMRMQREVPGFVSYKRRNKPKNTFLSKEQWEVYKEKIHNGEITLKKASEELNYNLSTLSKKYYSEFPEMRKEKIYIPEEDIEDILTYKSSYQEVAKKLGVSPKRVQSYIRYHYKDFSFSDAKAIIIKSRSSLSWEEIKEQVMSGKLSYVKAGEIMGVSNNYIKRKILKEYPDFKSPLYTERKPPVVDYDSALWQEAEEKLIKREINYFEAGEILGVSTTTARSYFLLRHPDIKLSRAKKNRKGNKKEIDR